ncbi:MAG: elongation factor Ts, partial [Elusimicrobia bacterium]|nr:elongation factor Ts [Elusimicrobiota bacterium]
DLARKIAEGSLTSPEAAATDIRALVARLKENVTLRRFEKISLSGPGLLSFYVHPPASQKGAFLVLECPSGEVAKHPATAELAKELGLQVVAMSPRWTRREDVPAAEVEKEREIYAAQLRNEGKPEAAIPKIVEGKLQKLFFQASCLLESVSMRDNKTPISKLVSEASARAGGPIIVRRFVRYQLGEN